MSFEEYYLRFCNTHTDKTKIMQVVALLKEKVEGLESANKHLQVEVEQKQRYQNEYNELVKQQNALKKELKQ